MTGNGASAMAARGGVRAFRLEGSGLERVLGDLEALLMEAVWNAGEASVQEVCDSLGPDRNYKTVMTVLNRLVDKGLLSRRRVSKAFVYSALESRQTFLDRVSRGVFAGLVRDFGSSAIAQFVAVVGELAPEELVTLEAMLHQETGRQHSSGPQPKGGMGGGL